WLGFALFGAAYLAMSLVPPIESRLLTTKALAYIDSRVPRSSPAGFAYFEYDDGDLDLDVANNSQANVFYRNKGNGTFQDMTTVAGLGSQATGSDVVFLNTSPLRGAGGATVNFIHIGHSLFALIAAFLGGRLSCYIHPGRT